MAKREVTVVINGEEYVSKAAKEAEAGLTGFSGFMERLKSKLIPVVDVTKLVELAVRALSAAFQAAKEFVLSSINAYDSYLSAQTKLAAQSKLTGVSMREMNALVDEARNKFGLSTVTAVDLAAAVAKFSSAAGDSSRAGQLMATALDLGAAAGMSASQVAEGLSSALAGNDEWLNRLGLSNPSVIWDKYREANGLAKDQMDDTTKAMALMTAIAEAGNKVIGVAAERMATGAGEQERLNNKLSEAQTAFGAAIQPLRIFVVQGLTALVNVVGPVVTALGYLASGVLNLVVGPLKLAYSGVGSVIEVVGKLSGNKDLEQWGRNASQEFSRFTNDVAKWLGVAKPATETTKEMAKAHELATVKIVANRDATDKHTESTKRAEAEHKVLVVALGMTKGALEKLGQAAKDQLPIKPAEDFGAAMDTIRRNADELIKKFPPITQETEDTAANTKSMAREVEGFARGAIDAAGAFGVIDESAQRSLNSAISIASSIGNMAKSGFSFAGAVGIIGGVASIVNTMMAGDAARRQLLRENNTALVRLSKDIGGLKLNVTGEDIARAGTAVRGLRLNDNTISTSEYRKEIDRFTESLGAQGMTIGEFERIAKELGINIRNNKGELSLSAINQAIQAVGVVRPGRVGQGFGDQLQFFRDSQRVNGNEGPGALQGLIDFLRTTGGVRALDGIDVMNDPQGAINALRALFTQLGNGEGISADGLGRLTGSQFSDIIMEIINGITGGGSGGGTISVPDGTGTGGGTVSAPTETIQSVIGAMNTNLGTILTTHTTLHERIAAATEGSYNELMTLNGKMDRLIEVTSGTVERTDAALEQSRRLTQLERGILPVLR